MSTPSVPQPSSPQQPPAEPGPIERAWRAANWGVVEKDGLPEPLTLWLGFGVPVLLLPGLPRGAAREALFGEAVCDVARRRLGGGGLVDLLWALGGGRKAPAAAMRALLTIRDTNGRRLLWRVRDVVRETGLTEDGPGLDAGGDLGAPADAPTRGPRVATRRALEAALLGCLPPQDGPWYLTLAGRGAPAFAAWGGLPARARGRWLCARLGDSRTPLPADARAALGLPEGATVGDATRALRVEL